MGKHSVLPVSKPLVADYLQVAVWSGQDTCYVGSVPPLVGPASDRSCRDDVAELFHDLDKIAEEYLDIFEKDGLPVPLPSDADAEGWQYLATPGDHLLRCRVLDAAELFLSDGAFQNQGGAHPPCLMLLPRNAPLSEINLLSARYLRFSKTLIVPIGELKPLSSDSFEVVGYSGLSLAPENAAVVTCT